MLARKNRFHGRGSLRFVYQHGQSIRGPLCVLKFVANNKRQDYRLAIVVSKKVAKSAVTRNRIRRRLYETFRQLMPLDQPCDMVVTVFHEQIATMPPQELTKLVHAQLKQAKII